MRCARDECDNTELTRARSRVHVVLRVYDSLDLGFHVVIGVGRLNVQQDGFVHQLHFSTHTQHQVQSSFLLDVVVRLCPCHRPLNLYPKFLHISHREKGSFEVLSLHLLLAQCWETWHPYTWTDSHALSEAAWSHLGVVRRSQQEVKEAKVFRNFVPVA